MATKQIHNYEGMDLVKKNYYESKETDTKFTSYMKAVTGRPYSVAQVRSYRQALGIPNNGAKPATKIVYIVTDGKREPVAVYSDPVSAALECAEQPTWSYHAFELQ